MRISQITKENYMAYLQLFGIKNTKKLDGLLTHDGKTAGLDQFGQRIGDYSHEAQEARMVAAGYAEAGMLIREGDTSWKKIVPVADEIKNTFIETARRQFMSNGNGMSTAPDGDEISALLKEYRKSVPPSARLSFTHTINQILQTENQRLIDYVRTSDPSWTHGKQIDPEILKKAVSGGLDIKV